MDEGFSHWENWSNRNGLSRIKFPGVYALAFSEKDISGSPHSWSKEVIYIGMTNSKGGLKSRLQQFENTIIGKEGHGGARRVMRKHPDYGELVSRLYVSVCPKDCNASSCDPVNLRLKGEVAKQEYDCFADFVEVFHVMLEFNDMKRSPKK